MIVLKDLRTRGLSADPYLTNSSDVSRSAAGPRRVAAFTASPSSLASPSMPWSICDCDCCEGGGGSGGGGGGGLSKKDLSSSWPLSGDDAISVLDM